MALEQSDDYLAERYNAAQAMASDPNNRHVDRITTFMMGAQWEQNRQKRSQPASADTGPRRVTVGDLSASMIGNTTARVEHEGGTVEGVLLDIEIDTDHANIPRGDERYRPRVIRLLVSLRIGSFTIDGLLPEHPVEIVR